jgi:Flp pilus assembly protein TadD
MARPGKEQVFFFATLGLTGLLAALLLTDSWKARGAPRGKAPDPKLLVRTDVAGAPRGALKDAAWPRGGREAFREPRDWLPLPPADLERPPLREPAYVPPPPLLHAGLDRLGLYRTASKITPHQFPEEKTQDAGDEGDDGAPVNAATANAPKKGAAGDPKAGGASATNGAGSPPSSAPSAAPSLDDADLRRRFDWLEVAADPKPWYGFIVNQDKFTLATRPEEKVLFQRLDPKTSRLMGQGAIERTRLKQEGIHFAETAANKTELLLRQNPESQWTATRLPALLDVIEQILPLGHDDPVAWRRAAEQLGKYVALDPHQPRTYELLADARGLLLDFEAELLALKQAETAGVESPGLVVRRARWLARMGARAGALARLADGVHRFPNERSLRLAYGRALLAERSPEDDARALEQFSQAEQGSTTGDERMEVIAEVGAALLEQGEAERALQEGQRILKIDKGSPLGLRLQAAAEFALGRFLEAEGDWQKLRDAADGPAHEAEASLCLGIGRTRLGDFDSARAELRHAPQLDPRLGAAAAAAEAELLETTDHLDAALSKCRDAVARAPDDAHLHYFLGRLLRRSGDLDAARTELRRSLDLGANFPDLFTELGFVALLQGNAGDARRYFEESLAREDRAETKLLLAHAFLLADDLRSAREVFEQLNSAHPSSEAMLGLAYVDYKRGESPAAQQLWLQVQNELPNADPDDKTYAAKWLGAVLDLESKQVWEDSIQWHEVGNGWEPDNRYGLTEKIQPGAYHLGGTQRPGATIENWNYLRRDVELVQFCEYSVDVSFGAEQQGRVGFGLAHFFGGAATQQAPQIRASLMLAVEPDGTLLVQHREHVDDADWTKEGKVDVKPGESLHLTLRRKERGSATFQFLCNGALVGEPIEMNAWRGKTKQQVSALFFASAAGGKKVDATLERARRVEFLVAP